MSRRKLSTAEGVALVEAWQASGERQSAYCREQGIAVHLLQYWRKNLDNSAQCTKVDIIPVSCARPQDRVEHGTVSFCRRDDGQLSVLVTGTFDILVCRAAIELLP